MQSHFVVAPCQQADQSLACACANLHIRYHTTENSNYRAVNLGKPCSSMQATQVMQQKTCQVQLCCTGTRDSGTCFTCHDPCHHPGGFFPAWSSGVPALHTLYPPHIHPCPYVPCLCHHTLPLPPVQHAGLFGFCLHHHAFHLLPHGCVCLSGCPCDRCRELHTVLFRLLGCPAYVCCLPRHHTHPYPLCDPCGFPWPSEDPHTGLHDHQLHSQRGNDHFWSCVGAHERACQLRGLQHVAQGLLCASS